MRDLLVRMTGMLAPNFALREDLLQEALIHLWLTEIRRPGQTKSWYLQSSKFHLQHYLASGCSVDSPKRGHGHSHIDVNSEQAEELPALVDPGDSVSSQVSARDIISLLSPHLSPCELAVLDGLADGLGVREIGRRLEMSHTMVIKPRPKTASLRLPLERPSIPIDQLCPASRAGNGNQGNGLRHIDRANSANVAKWSIGFKQRTHANGVTQRRLVPVGAIPSWECSGLLKPARSLVRIAKRSRMAA